MQYEKDTNGEGDVKEKAVAEEAPNRKRGWWDEESGVAKIDALVPPAAYVKAKKRSKSPHTWLEDALPEALKMLESEGCYLFPYNAQRRLPRVEQEALIAAAFSAEKGYHVSCVEDGVIVTMQWQKMPT